MIEEFCDKMFMLGSEGGHYCSKKTDDICGDVCGQVFSLRSYFSFSSFPISPFLFFGSVDLFLQASLAIFSFFSTVALFSLPGFV